MDHLPSVTNAHRPIEVPYHGYTYKQHGFTNFPLPANVSESALHDQASRLEDIKHAAPYLQARFCFGLIREVLDIPLAMSDFIEEKEGRKVITTKEIPRYLRLWREKYDATARDGDTGDGPQLDHTRITHCLDLSFRSWQAIQLFADIVGPEVELAIQLIACALEHAMSCVLNIGVAELPWRQSRSKLVYSRMVEDGWCPSLIWQIGSSKLTWQYYVSLLGPPRVRKDHSRCEKEGSCLVDQQKTTDADNASQHVCSKSETCRQVSANDSTAIHRIVREGGIPLLEYRHGVLHVSRHTQSLDNEYACHQVLAEKQGAYTPINLSLWRLRLWYWWNRVWRGDAQDTSNYTAISHIWTDGLGNPGSNSMPHCQLERLNQSMSMIPWTNKCLARSLVQDTVWQSDDAVVELTPDPVKAKAERPLLFWIDTVCVPQDAELKRLAINNMRAIYNRANRVLVMDAGLTNINGQLSSEEVSTRVSLSNWIRRFWTLQEAVLAKVIWYRCGNDCYRHMAEEGDFAASTWLNEVKYYCQDFEFDWTTLSVHREGQRHFSHAEKVARVWSELKRREASFKEDQPICIATLLDMDIDSIQEPVGYDARFAKLWLEYKALPKRILFLPGPKLMQYPLRWAPASFHGLDGMPIPPAAHEEAKPSPNGLGLQHHGMICETTGLSTKYGFIPIQIGDDVYLVRENDKRGNLSWANLTFTPFKYVAVLLAQHEMHEEADRRPFDWAIGALVGIQSADISGLDSGAVLECEYLRTVSVLKRDTIFEANYRSRSPLSVDRPTEDNMIVAASWSAVRQLWLIT